MMLPTHALIGLALATPLLFVAPDLATAGLVGALIGSIFPDLDLYSGHRRTLHYPTIYTVLSVFGLVAAVLIPVPVLVGIAAFLIGAAVHCRMDRLGGGLELRPWEGRSDRAVYDHVQGRWLPPKRWIRYDGAPEDWLLLATVSVPLAILLDGLFQGVVLAGFVIGSAYVLLRRRLAMLAPVVFRHVPDQLASYVPDRYRT